MKAFAVIANGQSKTYGVFETNDQMREALELATQPYQNDPIGCQVILLEQVSKFKVKSPVVGEIVAEPSVEQSSDRGTPKPQGATQPAPIDSPEVQSYKAQLEPMGAEDLRQLATIKGIDGRITNRDRLIEELVIIYRAEMGQ